MIVNAGGLDLRSQATFLNNGSSNISNSSHNNKTWDVCIYFFKELNKIPICGKC